MEKTVEERTIENYKAQLKLLQGNIESKKEWLANQFIASLLDRFRENFAKIEVIRDEELKIDLTATNQLAIELRNSNDELIRIHSISLSNSSHDITTDFNYLKNRLEQAYTSFISGKELREKINTYNQTFIHKIEVFKGRESENSSKAKNFIRASIAILVALILLAVLNIPFSCSLSWSFPFLSCDSKTYAKKIVDMISTMNKEGVKINHSLIYFLPKLLYVSCLLFLINICYNNYSFHKNLANLYRDKTDMVKQLLALLRKSSPEQQETILNKMLEILTKDREFGVKNYGTGLNVNSTLPINFTPNAKS
jgi:hypothetical protein